MIRAGFPTPRPWQLYLRSFLQVGASCQSHNRGLEDIFSGSLQRDHIRLCLRWQCRLYHCIWWFQLALVCPRIKHDRWAVFTCQIQCFRLQEECFNVEILHCLALISFGPFHWKHGSIPLIESSLALFKGLVIQIGSAKALYLATMFFWVWDRRQVGDSFDLGDMILKVLILE